MVDVKIVEHFLKDFRAKLTNWRTFYLANDADNLQSLLSLDITTKDRTEVLGSLAPTDYCNGPILDALNNSAEKWFFGKMVKTKEVHITITIGSGDREVICIFFNVAENKLKYPLKK